LNGDPKRVGALRKWAFGDRMIKAEFDAIFVAKIVEA
jgi:hypothetical protein